MRTTAKVVGIVLQCGNTGNATDQITERPGFRQLIQRFECRPDAPDLFPNGLSADLAVFVNGELFVEIRKFLDQALAIFAVEEIVYYYVAERFS